MKAKACKLTALPSALAVCFLLGSCTSLGKQPSEATSNRRADSPEALLDTVLVAVVRHIKNPALNSIFGGRPADLKDCDMVLVHLADRAAWPEFYDPEELAGMRISSRRFSSRKEYDDYLRKLSWEKERTHPKMFTTLSRLGDDAGEAGTGSRRCDHVSVVLSVYIFPDGPSHRFHYLGRFSKGKWAITLRAAYTGGEPRPFGIEQDR